MMSKKRIIQLLVLLLMTASVVYTLRTKPSFKTTDDKQTDNGAPALVQDEFMRGAITAVEREKVREDALDATLLQTLRVHITNGTDKGKDISADYEIPNRAKDDRRKLNIGDKVVIGKSVSPQGTLYYVSDVYRLNALWVILGFFFLLTVFLSGWRGFMSFIGLGYSLFIVVAYIVPHILNGGNPFAISVIGTALIACVSLYLAHGVNKRSTIALIATLATTGLALGISTVFVHAAKLFGMGTEEAFYLQYAPIPPIDLRGLFLGGVIIGVLGILDDVTTTQAASVEEIYKANPTLSFHELYKRGASVGREHITSLVNTLVLAYTGASFPLIFLFIIYEKPLWATLNSELVIEEIMRTLIGSTVLMLAVPLTTALAAWLYQRKTDFIHQ